MITDMHRILITLAAAAVALCGCNVHEYPDSGRPGEDGYEENSGVGIKVRFSFKTELPDYTTIEVLDSKGYFNSLEGAEGYDARYTVQVFRYQNSYDNTLEEQPAYSGAFTVDDLDLAVDTTLNIRLDGEKYRVLVWMDFVEKGDDQDLFYDTADLSNIAWAEGHGGSNEFLQTFRGAADADLSNYQSASLTIDRPVKMLRPMAKYRIVATDKEGFLAEYRRRHGIDTRADEEIDLSLFHAVFTYTGNVPSVYDVFSDVPVDVSTGVSFKSPIRMMEDGTIELGTDYIFTGQKPSVTTVGLNVSVYEQGFESPVSSINFNIPLQRGGLTTAKGAFMTSSGGQTGTGGIQVVPTFDGEYEYTF